jgi:CDP-paratose 2-epimerase
MSIVLITGSTGLIGSESVRFFSDKGFDVVGIDNNLREYFFGEEASTRWNREKIEKSVPNYKHFDVDIRDEEKIDKIFSRYGNNIGLVIHAAAQPSHDWAAKEPHTDFTVNANGTLVLLEKVRKYCPQAVFIFTSTNKVYGDSPNNLPLKETPTRWELDSQHIYHEGIDESMSVDQSTHSLFGVSKLAADLMVQEYGRYFGILSACFRGGCLTGPSHSGAQLHGFLSYLMKCTITNTPYKILGYKGKQVRDNIHSYDLVNSFYCFFKSPRIGEVYNIGGGRFSNCSLLEAIDICEKISGISLSWDYLDENRIGDHKWWISSNNKFISHYPKWTLTYDINNIITDIYENNIERWKTELTRL